MSYLTRLQTNNTNLQACIDKANALSNYEDVTPETIDYTTKLTSLENAITALETELEGKASGGSGGGSVETCTVTITTAMGYIRSALATQYQNEQVIGYQEKNLLTNTVTIPNVIKGSIISFETYTFIIPAYSATAGVSQNGYPYSNASTAGNWSFTIAPTVSDNIEISVRDDD